MITADTCTLLKKLAEKIQQQLGLSFNEGRIAELEKAMQRVAEKLGMADAQSCVNKLLASNWQKEEIDALVHELTIGETYFFRDKKLWDVLEQRLLPALLGQAENERRGLNLWSAACCTGEEPYSLAMLLKRMSARHKFSKPNILATDLNQRFLDHAAQAIYSNWSFRTTSTAFQREFFQPMNAKHRLSSEIRSMVEFRHYNLASSSEHPCPTRKQKFDLIICRNVFVYFSQEKASAAILNLSRMLHENGVLIISPHDMWCCPSQQLESEVICDVYVLRLRKTKLELCGATSRVETVTKRCAGSNQEKEIPDAGGQINKGEPKRQDAKSEPRVLPKKNSYVDTAQSQQEKFQGRTPSVAELKILLEALCNAGTTAEALQWNDKAIEMHPLDESLYYTKANILHELGQHEQAIKHLLQAVFLNQNFVMAHFSLYHVHRVTGNTAQAQIFLRNVRGLLEKSNKDEILPEGDGMTVGQLLQAIN